MNKFSTIILSAVIGAVAAYGTVKLTVPHASSAEEMKESVYERVMRTGTIRCGFTPWPPFFALDPNTGELSGLNKDVADAIEKMLNIKFDYIEVSNGQASQDLKTGKIDVMCGDGPWMISSIKFVDYSKPYSYSPVYIYGRNNENRFQSLTELNKEGVAFVGIDGDLSSDLQARNFPKASIRSLPNISDPAQMLTDVATGKSDVVIIDPQGAGIFIKNNPDKIKRLFPEPVAIYGGGFSVMKGEQELLNMLDETVNALINTGAMTSILKKYDPDGTMFLPVDEAYKN